MPFTPLGNSNLLDFFEGSGVLYLQMEGSCMGKNLSCDIKSETLKADLRSSNQCQVPDTPLTTYLQ